MAMSFVCRCTIEDVNRMTMLGIEEKSSFNKHVILLSANFFLLIKEKMNFFFKIGPTGGFGGRSHHFIIIII